MAGPGPYGNKKPTAQWELNNRIYQAIARSQRGRYNRFVETHGTKPPMNTVLRWGEQAKKRLR